VLPGHTPSQRYADGAARNVNGALGERGGNAVCAEDDVFHSVVVGQHRHDGFRGAGGIGWGIGHARAIGGQSVGFITAAVENGYFVPGAKQIARHGGPHTAQSDKSNSHKR
jgi:hypothetical protein